jgi:hypothetical protein
VFAPIQLSFTEFDLFGFNPMGISSLLLITNDGLFKPCLRLISFRVDLRINWQNIFADKHKVLNLLILYFFVYGIKAVISTLLNIN